MPPGTPLAAQGKALQTIVVGPNASDKTKASAATLAQYLQKISGASFEVQNGDGKKGIAVGVAADFPALKLDKEFDLKDPTRREDYLLRSNPDGLLLIGASDLAVQNAVWDCLYRLGYRQFFPGKNWEIVPQTEALALEVNATEHPDYVSRRIWFSYGSWPEEQKEMDEWSARNRMNEGIKLNTGHAYGGIIKRHLSEFKAHPEYLTQPGGSKFCVSNPGLRQLVIDDALKYFADNPDADSYSVDPSDGGGWESDSCGDGREIGSVSDRVVTLANAVADAVGKQFSGKKIGFYAYNFHSPPPTIKVHPNVVVSIATAFIKGGFSVEQLVAGWQKQGATLGIREYYSIITWDGDLPARARASQLDYLQKTIPQFHAQGARFLTAESSDNWGPNGLGYYAASRFLWNTKEAAHADEIRDEFLTKSFGAAKPVMTEFYRVLTTPSLAMLSDNLLGRLYGSLSLARTQTDDAKVLARLDDLTLYVRYVELRQNYQLSSNADQQKTFEELLRFAYRIRGTHMVHSKGLWRDLVLRDKDTAIPKEANWQIPEGKNSWKSSEPFSRADLDGWIKIGIENYKISDVEAKVFSSDLIAATPLGLGSDARGHLGSLRGAKNTLRGTQDFYTWLEAGQTVNLEVTAGLIYQNHGPAKIQLLKGGAPAGDEQQQKDGEQIVAPTQDAVADASVAPDRAPHSVSLKATERGLYRICVSDATAGTNVESSETIPFTVESSLTTPPRTSTGWTLFFYVPKGTKFVGGFSSGQNSSVKSNLRDGDGTIRYTWPREAGYFNVPVPAGQDGKLWKIENSAGRRLLMTVPPYFARSAAELLLPREVVAADKPR